MGKGPRQLYTYLNDLQFDIEDSSFRGQLTTSAIITGLYQTVNTPKGRTPLEVFNMTRVYAAFEDLLKTEEKSQYPASAIELLSQVSRNSGNDTLDSIAAAMQKPGDVCENRFRLYGEQVEKLVQEKGLHTVTRAATSRDYRAIHNALRIL